jgi:hypothetical protein
MKRSFEQGQAVLGSAPQLSVSHTPLGSVKPNAQIDLTFTVVSDPMSLIAGIDLYYRAGSGAFSRLTGLPMGKVSLPRSFSSSVIPGAKVQYYAEVRDKNGAILEHMGSSELPFATQVEQPLSRSIAKKWWFWTVIGVAVAGAAVGLGVGLTQTKSPTTLPSTFEGIRIP